jgi:hypothetical protein
VIQYPGGEAKFGNVGSLPQILNHMHKSREHRVVNSHELASSMESYSTSQMLHREDRGHAFESTDRKIEEAL